MTRAMPRSWRRIYHVPRPFTPYRVGNSFSGIDKAARKGYHQIDLDANITKDGVVVICHWPKFAKDRFTDPKHRYPRGAQIRDLTLAQVLRLRAPRGYQIHTVGAMMKRCKRRGLTMCLEVKGDARFQSPQVWDQIASAARTTGCNVRVMTLQNLGSGDHPARRLAAAKRAGFPTILLARGRRPANWAAAWEPHVDYVRGRFR